jgi:ParB family chromosome partitioning protein
LFVVGEQYKVSNDAKDEGKEAAPAQQEPQAKTGKAKSKPMAPKDAPVAILVNVDDVIAETRAEKANIRQIFDAAEITSLAQTVFQFGVLQPIIVLPQRMVNGVLKYIIVAGERRWRAAREAGIKFIPAIVRNLTDAEVALIQITENVQRKDMTETEFGRGCSRLHRSFNMSVREIARQTGKDVSEVSRAIAIFEDENLRSAVDSGKIIPSEARRLTALSADERPAAIKIVAKNRKSGKPLTDADLRRAVAESKSGQGFDVRPKQATQAQQSPGSVQAVAQLLAQCLAQMGSALTAVRSVMADEGLTQQYYDEQIVPLLREMDVKQKELDQVTETLRHMRKQME